MDHAADAGAMESPEIQAILTAIQDTITATVASAAPPMPHPKPTTSATSATRFTKPEHATAMSGCHGDLHARNEACATDATNWNGTPTHRIAAYVSAAGTTAADLGPANAAMAGAAALAARTGGVVSSVPGSAAVNVRANVPPSPARSDYSSEVAASGTSIRGSMSKIGRASCRERV